MPFLRLTVDDVIRARERDGVAVRSVAEYYVTLCPAHMDRVPSLGFGEGADGSAWIRCYAGCRTADVVRALEAKGTGQPLDPQEVERRRTAAGVDRRVREERARELHACSLLHPDRERALHRIAPTLRWDANDLLERGVGWTGERVSFPVVDDDGLVTGVDLYAAPGTPARALVGERNPKLKARGTRGLWPSPATVQGEPLLLVEGAPAAATVLAHDLACVAFPSASGLRRVDARRLTGRELLILADADRAGRRAARSSVLVLRDVTVKARAIDLFEGDGGWDVADELRAREDGREWLLGELGGFTTRTEEIRA